MAASSEGHLTIVERLLAAGAQPDLQKKVLLVQWTWEVICTINKATWCRLVCEQRATWFCHQLVYRARPLLSLAGSERSGLLDRLVINVM